jgi:hypothetical protein
MLQDVESCTVEQSRRGDDEDWRPCVFHVLIGVEDERRTTAHPIISVAHSGEVGRLTLQ